MDDNSEIERELVVVPWRELPTETVAAVVEAFVLREGTNYGAEEHHFETKVAQVRKQLEEGSILMVFDTLEDSCTLLTSQELKRVRKVSSQIPESYS